MVDVAWYRHFCPKFLDDLRSDREHCNAHVPTASLLLWPTRLASLLRLLQELLCVVDGNGERNTRRHLERIDTDGLSVEIDQGASRVSECDGSVSLKYNFLKG